MRKSKIEWCEYTWNPVTGCYHNCPYCYAKTLTNRFGGDIRLNLNDPQGKKIRTGITPLYLLPEQFIGANGKKVAFPFGFAPTLHEYRLNWLENLKTGARVFVCSMADLFGSWVPTDWILKVFSACEDNPRHQYLFLTKNPHRYRELLNEEFLPQNPNMWFGYSVTKNGCMTFNSEAHKTFISVEPLLEDITDGLFSTDAGPAANWVIIGAETGQRKGKVIPKIEWVERILKHCDKHGIPVFMKDSLISVVGEENMRREFPAEMQQEVLSEKREQKLCTECCKCHKYGKKAEMTAISTKKGKRGKGQTVAFVCDNCLPEFLKGLGVSGSTDECEGLEAVGD